ncbi:MAG: FKBP-type peptidyl-prolyl cis-trans isomerase [bacterium]
MKHIVKVALLASTVSGCWHHRPTLPAPIPVVDGTPRELFALRAIDIVEGTGAPAMPRKCLYAHYTGWLTNGTKFDSSRDTMPNGTKREPLSFPQGAKRVISGWDVGFEGMKVGGQRRLIIPYQLAYGELGRPPVIPPKAELIFDVQLMAVADTLKRSDSTTTPRATPAVPQCATWRAVSGG